MMFSYDGIALSYCKCGRNLYSIGNVHSPIIEKHFVTLSKYILTFIYITKLTKSIHTNIIYSDYQ